MSLIAYKNEAFSEENVSSSLGKALQDLFALTARKSFSVSTEDEATILSARAAASAMVSEYFDRMVVQAAERRRNLETFEGVRFVSIGEDCFSRTVLTQWGVKPFAKLGEKSGPFDLSVHPITTTATLFETDFAGYLDRANLVFNPNYNFCTNPKLKVGFNHEVGPSYAENDFAPLIEIYERRLAHFRALMEADAPTVLVCHVQRPSAGTGTHIARLWQAIRSRWSVDNKILVAIKTWRHGETALPSATVDDPRVAVLDLHYPAEDYVWHLPKYCFTRDGFAFERQVVDFVKQASGRLVARAALAA
ncbi:hypothetical protein [Prosthecomicrobium pneumaticum]|uniref:Uncharacterized protein n=1 Tax=Prosthecomicrobium pneumaticum TaxID=81895 RepID=A0A7W9FJ43_9HYPH|nr:hypothetical protein [Prosthecomicrobium pneumaticum]MBB5751347.1 hypothetical protein [Prosthecomicrobium pneumaticum]